MLLATGAGLVWEVLARRALLGARVAAAEVEDLVRRREAQAEHVRSLESRVERLAVIREIHRSTSLRSRGERLRHILSVIGDMSSAAEVVLFVLSRETEEPVPAAYRRRLPGGEIVVYLDRPDVAAGATLEGGVQRLTCRHATEERRGGAFGARADLMLGSLPVGEARLIAPRDERTAAATVRARLEDEVAASAVNLAGVAVALEERRLFRVQDAAGAVALAYPLMAEGAVVGVLRARLPAKPLTDEADSVRRFTGEAVAAVEEVLLESAGHIGLAVKRDEDTERAARDALTGLLAKGEFHHHLRETLGAARSGAKALSLVMIDIDHFKSVNDTYGHPAGDAILRGVAGSLQGTIRARDLAYRYGGEELAVLLVGAPLAAGARMAERIRRAVKRATYEVEEGRTLRVTVSLGVASAEAGEGLEPEDLLSRADEALYASKRDGRDRTTLYREGRTVPVPRESGRQAASAPGRSSRRAGSSG